MLTHEPYGCMEQVICICVNLKKVDFFLFFFLLMPQSKKKQEVHNLQKRWNVFTSKVHRFPTHTLSLVGSCMTQMKSIIIIVKETVEQFTHSESSESSTTASSLTVKGRTIGCSNASGSELPSSSVVPQCPSRMKPRKVDFMDFT